MDIDDWPNCTVADCPLKACLPDARCYPHTHGLPLDQDAVNHMEAEFDAREGLV